MKEFSELRSGKGLFYYDQNKIKITVNKVNSQIMKNYLQFISLTED